jgi:hypothetical protein
MYLPHSDFNFLLSHAAKVKRMRFSFSLWDDVPCCARKIVTPACYGAHTVHHGPLSIYHSPMSPPVSYRVQPSSLTSSSSSLGPANLL